MALYVTRPGFAAAVASASDEFLRKWSPLRPVNALEPPALDVFSHDDGKTLVIASSAEEAAIVYRSHNGNGRHVPPIFERVASDVFSLTPNGAHENGCPLRGTVENCAPHRCASCAPAYTREQLIEAFGRGYVIVHYP